MNPPDEVQSRTELKTFVIAEMACSHEGDPVLARTIVDGAVAAGANAIQFQIWRLASIVVPQHRDYQRIGRLELSQQDWASLAEYVRSRFPRMQIIACVQDHDSIDFARDLCADAYKLHFLRPVESADRERCCANGPSH